MGERRDESGLPLTKRTMMTQRYSHMSGFILTSRSTSAAAQPNKLVSVQRNLSSQIDIHQCGVCKVSSNIKGAYHGSRYRGDCKRIHPVTKLVNSTKKQDENTGVKETE
jgi:arginine/lysine/ornithine decarboxylase